MNFFRPLKYLSISFVFCLTILPQVSPGLQAFPYLDRGKRGMVTSAHPLASAAGLTMLQRGGNAVDAAVATTLAISVVEPFSAGIGGGGFLLLRLGQSGELKALDFRERAPLAATRTMFLDAQGKVRPRASVDGYLAAATPGTIAGLYEVHRLYGKLAWKDVVAPAIQLAKAGFPVSGQLATVIARRDLLRQNPAGRQIFTRDGTPLQPGETLVQRDLARTLETIAQNPQSFYTGTIAAAIAKDMAANNGLIRLKDLQTYRPIWREPVCGNFRATRVCSMPPPSSGGVHLLQILNLIGDKDLKAMGWHNPDALHWIVEAMKIAYADRSQYLGDPDFVDVPVKALISPIYANQRRQEIDPQKARPSNQVKPADPKILQSLLGKSEPQTLARPIATPTRESPDTSHLNVVDETGTAVSLTFTINLEFGAGVVVPGTGILLNNEMDDFAIAPDVPNAFGLVGRDANAIAPGKTPLSSMTPTIVTENGQLRLVAGSPGGSTIITTVLQVVLNVLVYDMDARRAVAAPRLHHQWLPDQLRVEKWGFDPLTLDNLRQRGHPIKEQNSWGNAHAIVRTSDGWLEGASDPRGEGAAYGY
ncbi:gamma-glutamyltransferase [Kovacikia minuta CCNUW1]|uniref:gamma-glutamyltransferase n=1 Tax=Kovacikia minuta TaxID=2931930 RepID=UPI001CC9AE06|nr:gamma-glutamyltransferase [Kovacikia minuta]UBF29621.1 gamma-glutamyltransferase [Kovacikia minuta CCNUW1]